MQEHKTQNDWQHRQKQDSKPWKISMPYAVLKMKSTHLLNTLNASKLKEFQVPKILL